MKKDPIDPVDVVMGIVFLAGACLFGAWLLASLGLDFFRSFVEQLHAHPH